MTRVKKAALAAKAASKGQGKKGNLHDLIMALKIKIKNK